MDRDRNDRFSCHIEGFRTFSVPGFYCIVEVFVGDHPSELKAGKVKLCLKSVLHDSSTQGT